MQVSKILIPTSSGYPFLISGFPTRCGFYPQIPAGTDFFDILIYMLVNVFDNLTLNFVEIRNKILNLKIIKRERKKSEHLFEYEHILTFT